MCIGLLKSCCRRGIESARRSIRGKLTRRSVDMGRFRGRRDARSPATLLLHPVGRKQYLKVERMLLSAERTRFLLLIVRKYPQKRSANACSPVCSIRNTNAKCKHELMYYKVSIVNLKEVKPGIRIESSSDAAAGPERAMLSALSQFPVLQD